MASPSSATRPRLQVRAGRRSQMSLRIRAASGVASIMAGIGSCQPPKSSCNRAAVSPSSLPPAAAFHVAYQMILSPLAGPRPKRAPRPQVSVPSPGSGTDPGAVMPRTTI